MIPSRRITTVALTGALLLGLAGCSGDTATESPAEEVSVTAEETTSDSAPSASPIPSFTAVTLDGTEFTSTELEGRPSVLWFWAPWCSTCRAEAPDIATAAAALNGEVEVIGVGALGPVVDMETFVDDTNLADLRHLADEDARVWADFGVAAQPAFAFIGADGAIEIVQGSLNAEQIVERAQALS
jgi:thiol-disulfide isomerase/thioredoxin